MAEIAIALVASVYIIMKISERIVKDWSHKKVIEVQEYEYDKEIFKKQIEIAEKNFSVLEEEIRDLREEVNKFNERDLAKSGRF